MTERRGSLAIASAMTVDIEDYFQVQAFADAIPRTSWETIPRRVEANTERILARFEEAGVRATFFTLGWIAERHRGLIRQIVGAGHELASHGYDHVRADCLDRAGFRADVGRTRRLLEDLGGVAVRGYRAPTFSIGPRNMWAFAALEAEGYAYSSSIYPVRHDLYGMPDAPRFPFRPGGGALWELPMTTLAVGGYKLPWSGGGYFRLLPYRLYKSGLRRMLRRDRRPAMFYFHPWEIDPDQPRVANCQRLSRLRHRLNLGAMERRVGRLLDDFAWDRVDRVFAAELSHTAASTSAQG
jgi:polysaccharide deacetylase family protein (PEP-CTERM system associated)